LLRLPASLPADFGNAGMDKDEIEELQEALLRECLTLNVCRCIMTLNNALVLQTLWLGALLHPEQCDLGKLSKSRFRRNPCTSTLRTCNA
jgi:hypothetical protein